MTNAADIAGYTYGCENYMPEALIDVMIAQGTLPATARDRGQTPDEILYELAERMGINRHDERSFDSGDFPKVIFWDQVDMECDWEWLGEEQPEERPF